MTFLSPLFLLGALAVAVPVIIHLTNREKKDTIEFPSLMFLQRIPYKSVRRQRLRHLFLFALRCLALLLLALAFARPFLETPSTEAASILGPRDVVLLIDNSYSMGYEDRLERARAEARAVAASLGAGERASVIVFSDGAEILGEPTAEQAELDGLIDGIELSSRTTRYGPALKLAKKIVDESERPRQEVLLISDFQRVGWEDDEDAWLPAGTTLTPVDLSSEATRNLSVTDLILDREVTSGRERLEVSARVTYKAPEGTDAASSRIRIELDGRTVQTKPLELAPNSSSTVSFDALTLPAGVLRGTVRIDADALPKDDAFHFVVWPGQSLSVLNLEGGGRRRQSLYIERALGIGDRPSFRVESKPVGELREEDLQSREVVILNDVPSLHPARARMLQDFVEAGGGLVVVLGESSDGNAFSGEAAALLPARPGQVVDRARDFGGTLSYLDYSSPVFELFSAPHSGDFSSAKFFRYRKLSAPVTAGVVARFDDGAVALAEKRLGEGRVLVWTSTLDTFWNDLARQPVFLPFVHRLIEHAAYYREASPWHTVGEVADLTQYLEMLGASDPRETDLVVSGPTEGRTIVPPSEEPALIAVEEQGFYEVREAGGLRSDVASIAANLDLSESDLATLDPEELVAAVTFRPGDAESVAAEAPADQERQQEFWWFLLVAAFVMLASETVLSNRLSRANR